MVNIFAFYTCRQIVNNNSFSGRQIKNAVRTAGSLALGRDEKLEYKHFVETLDAMDDFTNDFNAVNA
jgi:hypothetical protein